MSQTTAELGAEKVIAVDAASAPEVLFASFNLKPNIQRAIDAKGFKLASPIQAEAIPVIMAGHDVVAQAHTGTGKTAAFGIPAIERMHYNGGIEILIITPTRELANQVSDELYTLGRFSGVNTVTIYGGRSSQRQIELIERGAQIVVATPGRLLDLLSSRQIKTFNPTTVVLDEADEMLDMGFLDDINEIFTYLPKERQTLLFSATMPKPIKELAKRILKEPVFISVTREETTNSDISQLYYVIEESERDDAMIRLMDAEESTKSVVFCRTKSEVERVSTVLTAAGYHAKGLHGDMEQRTREAVIKSFKGNDVEILVATDVAARGLHIDNISHVFNYHIPFDPESYVHRIGRTGRAGQKGKAITLVTPHEFKELQRIKAKVGTTMEHCYIPSKSDVVKQYFSKLIAQIEAKHVRDDAHMIIDALKEDLDLESILYKMASLLIENQEVQGPNTIGIPQKRLETLLERLSSSPHGGGGGRTFKGRRNSGGSSSRGPRSGGGDRPRSSEGGGGYRGNSSDRNSSRPRSNDGNRSGGGNSRPSNDNNRWS